MGPLSYMPSFVDRNVVMRRIPVSSPGAKRSGRVADHASPSNAEAKNEWSYTSIPHIPSWRV